MIEFICFQLMVLLALILSYIIALLIECMDDKLDKKKRMNQLRLDLYMLNRRRLDPMASLKEEKQDGEQHE